MRIGEWKGQISLFLAFSLAGTSVIAARLVSSMLGTFTITTVSLFFAVVFLVLLCGRKLVISIRELSMNNFVFLWLQALCGVFLFRMFLLNGLLHTSTGEAGILTGAVPAITAILAIVILKEAVNGKKLAGIICTVGGILILQGLMDPGHRFSLEHWMGNILVLCAAACESTFSIISRIFAAGSRLKSGDTLDAITQTAIVSAIALVLCLIPALWESPVTRLGAIGWKEWLVLIWYGVIVTALSYIFWYTGINRCGALTAASFSGLMPLTSILLSLLVLGEHIEWHQWLGGFLVICGIFMIGIGGSSDQDESHSDIRIPNRDTADVFINN